MVVLKMLQLLKPSLIVSTFPFSRRRPAQHRRCEKGFAAGAARVIVGTRAVKSPDFVRVTGLFWSRVIVLEDARDGRWH